MWRDASITYTSNRAHANKVRLRVASRGRACIQGGDANSVSAQAALADETNTMANAARIHASVFLGVPCAVFHLRKNFSAEGPSGLRKDGTRRQTRQTMHGRRRIQTAVWLCMQLAQARPLSTCISFRLPDFARKRSLFRQCNFLPRSLRMHVYVLSSRI